MMMADLIKWMNDNSRGHIVWYAKRLSGNDTLANGSHQAGPYIPKELLFEVFPSLNRPDAVNPDKIFRLIVDSHSDGRRVRAIWYNNRFRGGTRNEARMTGFGGSSSALLDPESTGSIAVFAFHRDDSGEADLCHVWVCRSGVEEELVEERIGPVEPGRFVVWTADSNSSLTVQKPRTSCWLKESEIPSEWLASFPSGAEIVRKTVELQPCHRSLPIDRRLMKRRECEYEIFRSVEQAAELPIIKAGFQSVDDFVNRANSILQRRKSRSGKSLELHAREIFLEEDLKEGIDFDAQPESDPGKRPDFLFPNEAAYKDIRFPTDKLRLLAVKTTCKDRWRQVLNEADRIQVKHILTLQEGISENQFREMTEARVRLVVPEPLVGSYPQSVRPHLQTFESFIADVRLLNLP